jgi:exosortase B
MIAQTSLSWMRERQFLMILAGWLLMFVPVYTRAMDTLWQTEDQGHGPLILIVCVWLFWQRKEALLALAPDSRHALGWPLVLLALLMYLVGQVFGSPSLSLGAQVPLALGLVLLFKGTAGVRAAWFALLFLVFMVPLPGSMVDATTHVLKQWISVIVTEVLYWMDYPISRTGVTISVGQYQLLVADACSGMHSLFSLSALGTLYMYVVGRTSRLHNAIMLLLILPIAFFANIVRVTILVLVTYYFGEDAGRGFLHGFAGMALLVVSLSVLFAADGLLARIIRPRQPQPSPLCAAVQQA